MAGRESIGENAVLRVGQTVALEPETAYEHRGDMIALKIEDCFVVEEYGLRPLGPIASLDDCVIA